MTTDKIGVYVHIPFCIRKCNYCDFCSYPDKYETVADAYIERLLSEAQEYKKLGKISADTLYFGGGTPSLLSPLSLEKILSGLSSVFDFSPDTEFTLEANPGTVTRDKLRDYKSLGVNRISIGLQSIHDNELKKLGRIHSYAEFYDCYNMLRALGYDNLSVDLMYGIPEQTTESFDKTLSAITELSPEHISAYGLILEEETPFYKMRDSLAIPDEDTECDMYRMACERLARSGYGHYEISNYAKPGRESRHNLKYWLGEEFIGLGAAAYSYLDGARFGNVRSLDGYMSGAPRENTERESIEDKRFEYAMMRLRLARGIDLREYEARFGTPFLEGREEKINKYVAHGLMTLGDGSLAFTERGFYLSNTVMADIL